MVKKRKKTSFPGHGVAMCQIKQTRFALSFAPQKLVEFLILLHMLLRLPSPLIRPFDDLTQGSVAAEWPSYVPAQCDWSRNTVSLPWGQQGKCFTVQEPSDIINWTTIPKSSESCHNLKRGHGLQKWATRYGGDCGQRKHRPNSKGKLPFSF